MKKIFVLSLCAGCLATVSTSRAIDLKESKVTQVVNDVEIISAANQNPKAVVVDDIFSMPDILRTGAASRAELVAKDETITRVGANTIFSFDPASRTINLKQGSLLFHSPHGKGGGTIHTGSATASVLGTTLIVTTTKDGGMKVLDLEGSVEVNLDNKNKKKQKLAPGQMTFILPGSSELAPIIVFRLDELVKNSLLVHGFGKPITSMPLIQDQIDRQKKLIKAGRASDTGLLVGDSATPNQVEVLDPNTIQTSDTSFRGAKKALNTDANITSSSLKDPAIPTPPNRIFMNKPFSLAGNSYFSGQKFYGFAGRNISFNSSSPLSVDVSPYSSQPVFNFVAAKDINLNTSVTFAGLSAFNQFSLIGGENIFFAPNITVQADAGDFEVVTPGAMTLDTVKIINQLGDIGLNSGSSISLKNISVLPAGEFRVTAPDAVDFSWDQDGFLGQQGTSGGNTITTDAGSGEVTLTSTLGSLTVDHTSIQAHYLTLNSGDSILLDCAGHTLTATGPGATANFTAPNVITIKNTDLTSFAMANIVSDTITIINSIFNPNTPYNCGTKTGLANINGPVVYGRLNLINDSIGSTPITSINQINFTAGPVSTPGINSYKNN